METKVSSATKEVIIGDERPTVLIGERINPSGKKKMAEALRAGNLDIITQEARAQVDSDVLPFIPLGRIAEPEEITNVVVFLCSKESDYMTGQSINVTGGRILY